mmetsp:Transcript_32370/g.65879  ORF Transcript_32370/g.65879 Transcript_32370/m.65879 type:complete len:93 (+) Transcript_32370:3170-3448(+)
MLDIIPIEIRKELLEPLVHDLMIGPAMLELVEEDGPPLSGFVSEGGEDGVVEVLFDGFAVALVEVAGPVVGGALGAHVVACCVDPNIFRGLK